MSKTLISEDRLICDRHSHFLPLSSRSAVGVMCFCYPTALSFAPSHGCLAETSCLCYTHQSKALGNNLFEAESSLDQSASLGTRASGAPFPLAPFSPQEQRVFRLLGTGYSNPEIATALVVSLNTVKTQMRSIYQKLNVRNRKEARALLRS